MKKIILILIWLLIIYSFSFATKFTTRVVSAFSSIVTLPATFSSTIPQLTFLGDEDTGIGHPSANVVSLIAGGSEQMRAAAGTVQINVNAVLNGALTTLLGLNITPSTTQTLIASDAILSSRSFRNVAGSGGAVTLTSNPQIATGAAGTIIIVRGTSDTNTLTIIDGNGVKLNGNVNCTLGVDDFIAFTATDTGFWCELFRSNN